MAGITEILETMEELKELTKDFSDLRKSGVSIESIPKVGEIVFDITALSDAGQTLPELKDLDAAEAGVLMEASYLHIKEILDYLAKK